MNLDRKKIQLLMYSFLSMSLVTITSCKTTTQDPNDPVAVAENHNDAKFNTDKKDDADFLVDITKINLEEIQLGKLAQSDGMSKEIKALGKKMEEAHSKSLAELKKLAKEKSISIPDSLESNDDHDYSALTSKQGNEFDRSFCEIMTDQHKKAIEKCEKASTDAEDIDIKNWANKMLPELRSHLDEVMTCGEKYKSKS